MAKFGMIKEIIVKDMNNEEQTIKLVYNAFTFIIYKNFTGNDLMEDIFKLGTNKDLREVISIIDKNNIKTENDIINMPEEDLKKVIKGFTTIDNFEFFLNLVASMIASGKSIQEQRSFDNIISEIPPDFIYNQDIMNVVMELITFCIETQKKNLQARFNQGK